ncbi:MAG: PBP1A family penicillin-binding protein [Luteitalea sp.]|nr:PBP1A family penicillin-binding protein [Luteitalea sp.]
MSGIRLVIRLKGLGHGSWAGFVGRLYEARPGAALVSVLLLSVVVWATFGALVWLAFDVQRALPDRDELKNIGQMAQTTVIYDMDDQPVFFIFRERRMDVPLESVSPHLIRATIAIEDQRFFQHAGVDLVRIAGAAVHNFRTGRRLQGGSTITQQLARQSFLTLDRTLRRKIKEALVALSIERTFSKEEILELYLNKVYFGDGYYGVEAASRGFFGKPSAELTVAEAALLAGLVKSPSTYAPTISREKAVTRRDVVLQAMLGHGAIDQAGYEQARQAPVRLRNGLHVEEGFGQYFKRQVQRELVQRFGWERVSEEGLKVYTTLDPSLQREAEKLLEQELARIESRPGYTHTPRAALKTAKGEAPSYLQGALVTIDPQHGAVRAMVGGRTFQESRFNRAVQARRQPGSAFKPFVYAAAIEEGYSPTTMLTDLDDPVLTPEGDWVPEDEHRESTEMTMRIALRTSSNRAAVRMLRTVGLDTAMMHISHLGFGKLPTVPSIVLGAGEVTLEAMTAAYAAFANGGLLYEPTLIRRIEDREGNVLYEAKPRSTRVFSEVTAFIVANMLQDVINRGTAWRVREAGFRLPAAGKTGTTNNFNDAWFVGFTPRLATGVWVGFDQPQQIMANGYGGEVAGPVWAAVMKAATRDDKANWLERPDGVVGVDVCRVSGKRSVDGCHYTEVVLPDGNFDVRSMVYTEYFREGGEPTETCDVHTRPPFFDRMAGWFRRDDGSVVRGGQVDRPPSVVPPPADEEASSQEARPAPPTAAGAEDAPADEEVEPEKPKKRGFWARLFGRGDKEDDKKDEEKNEEKDEQTDEKKKKPETREDEERNRPDSSQRP